MPALKEQEFFTHIEKDGLAPVYLLAGEEGYFIDRALGRIVERALAGAPRDFNLDVFYAKDTKAEEVAAQASTLPMMARKRVVVLKEADRLRDAAPLLGYLESPSPDSVLVLVAENADRAKERPLAQAVSEKGVAVHFYHPYESALPRWIKTLARESGYGIDDDAAACLKEVLGGNLALIEAELNKVFNFLGERKTVTYDDVKEAVGDFGLPLVFDLVDAAAEKRPGDALLILSRLLREGEQPLMLLGMLAGHWRKLLAAREMKSRGEGEEKLVKAFSLNFANRKRFLGQVSRLSEGELIRGLHLFHGADIALKGSSLPSGMVIERLVLELAGAER